MKLRYTRRAHADLAAIFRSLKLGDPNLDRAVPARIKAHLERLPIIHATGEATVEPRVRVMTVDRDPYAIYYTVSADPPEIAILHIRRT